MTADPVRVLVVDDQELLRRGLRLLLATVGGLDVVAEAADGAQALAALTAGDIDVVLTDAVMPGMGGVEFVAAAGQRAPGVPVIVLTTFDDGETVREALAAGAAGFWLKDTSPEQLGEAIFAVLAGGVSVDPRVAPAVLRRGEEEPDPLDALTPAERQVAERVAAGETNAEIAAALFLAEGTVKNHVSALLRKLGQRDRTGLALMLYRAHHRAD